MISIIVPVLDEEDRLPVALNRLQQYRQQGHEVIVVDGGSVDNSLLLAQHDADKVIVSRAGRARQMNSGAAVSSGDILLFLHVDTLLPDHALMEINSLISGDLLWGHFDIRLSSDRIVFRLIEWMTNLRSRVTSISTGDQVMFISKVLFDQIGGFPEIALMEDVAISTRLKKMIKPVCLRTKVTTSSRRWENNGVVATVLLMWKLRLYFFFGVSPDKIKQMYR